MITVSYLSLSSNAAYGTEIVNIALSVHQMLFKKLDECTLYTWHPLGVHHKKVRRAVTCLVES